MDPTSYRDLKTSRGLNYHYFVSPSQEGKPVLLFLHGFPSTSYDWRHQVAFFQKGGYGLLVPDMLGYGGTSKPTDPEFYRSNLISKDIIDILDAEQVDQAVLIAHDWGVKIASRLANLYADRFIAFAFLAVGYMPPQPQFNLEVALAMTKKAFGYELFGYWKFLSEDGADKIVETNWDSAFSLIWPSDPKIWITDFAPTGGLKAWIQAGKEAPLAPYITEEEKKIQSEALLKGGMAGPVCWYKAMTSGISIDDDKSVPVDKYEIHKPVFFGAAQQDYVALAATGKQSVTQLCKSVTIREFDTGHWVMLEAKDEVNQELSAWIQGLVSKL